MWITLYRYRFLWESPPWRFTSPLRTPQNLGHGSLLRGLGGCTLRKEGSPKDPSTSWPGYLVTLPGPGGQRVQPASSLCTRVFGPSSDKADSTGLSGVSVKVNLPSCVHPTLVQPWDSSLLRSQGSDSTPCLEGGKELIRHFLFFFKYIADALLTYRQFAVLCLS